MVIEGYAALVWLPVAVLVGLVCGATRRKIVVFGVPCAAAVLMAVNVHPEVLFWTLFFALFSPGFFMLPCYLVGALVGWSVQASSAVPQWKRAAVLAVLGVLLAVPVGFALEHGQRVAAFRARAEHFCRSGAANHVKSVQLAGPPQGFEPRIECILSFEKGAAAHFSVVVTGTLDDPTFALELLK